MNKRIPDERIRAAKAAAPIDLVAGLDRELVRGERGEFKCLCPFHPDTNPSCTIVPEPEGGFYKCFSCGAGGDAIMWLMQTRGLTFPLALDELEKVGGTAPPPEVIESRRRTQSVVEARERAESVAMAQHLWQSAAPAVVGEWPACLDGSGPDHPRARAYFEARGIAMADLPGGVLPPSLRFLGSCPRGRRKQDERTIAQRVPAVIGLFVSPDNRPVGVQRIFLDESGEAKKLAGGQAKMTLGSTNARDGGGAVRLCPVSPDGGLLYLAEGMETGLAVLASLHATKQPWAAVWSVLGTSGLRKVEITDEWRSQGQNADGSPRGPITGVVIVADYDKSRAGQKAADQCAARMVASGLPAWIVTPSHDLVPTLIDADGRIVKGKGVDWLDVVAVMGATKAGIALNTHRVAKQAEAAGCGDGPPEDGPPEDGPPEDGPPEDGPPEDGPPSGASWPGEEGEDEDVLPADGRARAKMFLRQVMKPVEEGGAWPIVRAAGSWWTYRPVHDRQWGTEFWRWDVTTEERVTALLTAWGEDKKVLNRYRKRKPVALGGDGVATIRRGLASCVDPCADTMPMLLPPAKTDAGWQYMEPLALMTSGGARPDDREVVAFADCLLDVKAWMHENRVQAEPRTSRYFSRTCAPFRAPLNLLKACASSTRPDDVVAKACPIWTAFLADRFQNSEACIGELQKFCGYLLTPGVAYHKLLWLQGESGTGKGVIREVVTMICGEDNVASTDFSGLGERFGLAPLVGKSVWVMSELRMDAGDGAARALDRMLKLSSGEPVDVEHKHGATATNVRLKGKFMLTPNEAPPIRDSASALIRRLLVIPVLGQAVGEGKADPFLADKLRGEAAGIVAWFLMGLRRLAEQDGFVQPAEGKRLRDEMQAAQSPVADWYADCCETNPLCEAAIDDMFASFNAWCAPRNMRGTTIQAFGRALFAAVPGLLARQATAPVEAGERAGRRVRVYKGVKLVTRAIDLAAERQGDGQMGW
jgi:P4 family phage/plasmid primase-like protien